MHGKRIKGFRREKGREGEKGMNTHVTVMCSR